MNEHSAKLIIDYIMQVSEMSEHMLIDIQSELEPAEYDKIRKHIAIVLGELLIEILNPIVRQFPHLKPEGLE